MNRTDRLYALVEELRAVAPLALTAAEALAISVALRESASSPFAAAAASAALKVLATLPADVRAREQLLAGTLYESGDGAEAGDGAGDRSGNGAGQLVAEAIDRQRVLGLAYTDREGRRTERDVEPLGLLRSPRGWYLIAYCRLRDGIRGFRLASIQTAVLRDERSPARDPAVLRRDLARFDARALLRM